MKLKYLVPWRIRHRIDIWLENSLRRKHACAYKLIKFGRRNINTQEYWDKVWSTDSVHRNYTELFDIILEMIPHGTQVLDVGCGTGRLAKLMRDKRGAQVTGLDLSPWACEQLAKEGFETIVCSLPRIPLPDNTYDVAVATEVLEHLDHPEKTLRQMARVVKPRGLVMCSVPNDALYPSKELEHQQAFSEGRLRSMLCRLSPDIEIRKGRLHVDSDVEFLCGIAVIR